MSTADKAHAYFGYGAWEAYGGGRVTVGASDAYVVGSEGGEEEHILTTAEMPSHKHVGIDIDNVYVFGWDNGTYRGTNWMKQLDHNSTNIGNRVETGLAGDSKPHNNMQPYRTVYRWRRIA